MSPTTLSIRTRIRFPSFPCLLAISLTANLFADTRTIQEPPPRPDFPDRHSLSDEEFQRQWEQWRIADADWEANLTAEQVLYLQERERENSLRNNEKYEKSLSLPQNSEAYDWRENATKKKLSAQVVAALEQNQIAFGDSCRQSFDPYLEGPVFITSDSILNAFHVLLEDSFRELELRRAESFRALLNSLRSAVSNETDQSGVTFMKPDRYVLARAHVDRVLGPAMVLMGEPLESFPDTLRSEIKEQVDLIKQAGAPALPDWLAPTDPNSLLAIDYSSFKPLGFYAESKRLTDYFRAIRWLQLVPFRAGREHEFDAMILLLVASKESNTLQKFAKLTSFLGPGDDPTMLELARILDNVYPRRPEDFDQSLDSVRYRVAKRLIENGYYKINSDLRANTTVTNTFYDLTFRIVSATATPDAVVLADMMKRSLAPSGLAVASLLGSTFAYKHLEEPEQAFLDKQRAKWLNAHSQLGLFESAKLFPKYLDTLQALFLEQPEEAPAFMKSEAWEAKSCQTALAGWAQARHTFTLQTKISQDYLGLVMIPPGFVEPNPEFFARVSRLLENARDSLTAEGCFRPSVSQESDRLHDLAQLLSNALSASLAKSESIINSVSFEDFALLSEIGITIGDPSFDLFDLDLKSAQDVERIHNAIQKIEAKAEATANHSLHIPEQDSLLRERWTKLIRTARTLECLAHKQLRGKSWSTAEEDFLKGYGEDMAFAMGYFGNSWLTPLDDAPRSVEIASFSNRNRSLYAAIGRPRKFHVLYPWNNMKILCTGSVMQYYEFESKEPATDKELKDQLDTPLAPKIPEWITPFASEPKPHEHN